VNNITTSYIKDSVLKIVIYYSSLAEIEINDTASFPPENLLSNIGGNMGFFLGASIISVFELIILLIKMICSMNKRARQMILLI
jgi:uncharacterized membrane protein